MGGIFGGIGSGTSAHQNTNTASDNAKIWGSKSRSADNGSLLIGDRGAYNEAGVTNIGAKANVNTGISIVGAGGSVTVDTGGQTALSLAETFGNTLSSTVDRLLGANQDTIATLSTNGPGTAAGSADSGATAGGGPDLKKVGLALLAALVVWFFFFRK